ncbi:MAG TPA: hypothetical protein VMF05_13040 [Stellaceae bacterium]|nr:hypothetical protein [Stellaceae bacterium]
MKTIFDTTEVHPDYLARLRTSMRRAIGDAKIREQTKVAKGGRSAAVTITLDQVMTKLKADNYCCALTGLEFWTDDADRYGPTMPSLDRIDPDGDYSDGNIRVVLYGVNGLRGRGSDADMYRIAAALIHRERRR